MCRANFCEANELFIKLLVKKLQHLFNARLSIEVRVCLALYLFQETSLDIEHSNHLKKLNGHQH